jgi:L-seryl-tRNA(Ser) seleniumtransferase
MHRDQESGADAGALRRIPAVDALLQEPELVGLARRLSRETIVGLIRDELAERRRAFRAGEGGAEVLGAAAIVPGVLARARGWVEPTLRRVVNATGILLHTNLGRAPLPAAAQEAVARALAGYASLELDLATGRRTSRLAAVRALLSRVTGAEDALAVNNNAAAVFLALSALARDREVVVSRGELVEIGGSFRLPDIMEASGARLREVGTTNRTRLADYAAALSDRTGLVLKVHPSNFRVEGFTEGVDRAELARAAHARGVPLVEDLGSGALAQHAPEYRRGEPTVQAALKDGADLVTVSGDKLLGGPQAGLVLGRRELVERLRAHPAARVVRLDKVHLAALEATLLLYLRGAEGMAEIPLCRMAARSTEELRAAGAEVLGRLAGLEAWGARAELVDTQGALGGGSLPGETLPSVGIALTLEGGSPDAFARRLRLGDPAIVGRIERDRLILDLRTLTEDQWDALPAWLLGHLRAHHEAGAGGGGA